MTLQPLARDFSTNRGTYILLAVVLLVAAWLRFYHLGLPALERNQDEDIMAIAVMGILEHGYPLMPGGMIYLRSTPLLYLMAGSVETFGLTEFALRLPAAIFGWLLVPLGFMVARRYFGHACAITAAMLIAVSLWEVEVSRTARMYTPFAFFFTLTAYGICRGYLDNSQAWRWAVVPLAVFTITLHTLGFTLGAVLALVAIAFRLNLVSRLAAFGSAALVGIWFLYWDSVESAGFVRPRMLTGSAGMDDFAQRVDRSIIAKILDRFYFPEDVLFLSPDVGARLMLVLSVLCGGLLVLNLLRRNVDLRRPWPALFLIACLLAGIGQQFILSAGLFAGFVLVQGRGIWAVIQPPVLMVAGLLSLLFIGWFVFGITGNAGDKLPVYDTLRALFDYPRAEVIRRFVLERPFLMPLAGIGMAVVLHRASLERRLTSQAFLAVTMIVVLVLHGIFESQFRARYNFNLDALYMVFIAWGAITVLTLLRERIKSSSPLRSLPDVTTGMVAIVLALLIGMPNFRPAAALANVNNWEGSSPKWARQYGFNWPVDRKTTGVYVKDHAALGDKILAMDWLTAYFYAGQVDYWLRAVKSEDVSYFDGEKWRDMYIGAIVVPDNDALRSLLGSCRDTLWVITSAWIVRYQFRKLSPEIMRTLEALEPHLVYTGLDDESVVYRVPARGDCGTDSANSE